MFFKRILLFVSILPVLLLSCSEDEKKSLPDEVTNLKNVKIVNKDDPEFKVELIHDITISQLNEPYIESVWDVFEDDNARIYIQDNSARQIHQYLNDGTYIRSFGRKGKGPGEFQGLRRSWVKDTTLFTFDWITKTLYLFDTNSGEYVKSVNFNETLKEVGLIHQSNTEIYGESKSSFLFKSSRSYHPDINAQNDSSRYYRFSADGEI